MSRYVSDRPRDVLEMLDTASQSFDRLRDEVPQIYGLLQSQLPGPRSERVRISGHSDPTSQQALTKGHLKHHYRRAVKHVAAAMAAAQRAEESLKRAVDAADAREDFEDPDHRRWASSPPLVNRAEVREAKEAQQRRRDRGEVA